MPASIPAVLPLYLVVGLISLCFIALFGGIIGGAGLLDSANAEATLPNGTQLRDPLPEQ